MIIVPPEASLSPDGQTVTLRRGAWMETFNVAALPFRLACYRRLAALEAGDRPTDRDAIYGPTVAALEALTSSGVAK